MIHENQEDKHPENYILNLLVGMLIGGLVGALTMLLLVPQSGKDTRKQIEGKSIELRDRTVDLVDDSMAKVRTNANKIPIRLKDQVQEVAVDG